MNNPSLYLALFEMQYRSMSKQRVAIFWFRRDLRVHDNTALRAALESGLPVLPIFIFDTDILGKLQNKTDARVEFIANTIFNLDQEFRKHGSGVLTLHGRPVEAFKTLLREHSVQSVYLNHDYEPAAIARDLEIERLCAESGVSFFSFKDQVIFEKNEVQKIAGGPYTVFTPYSRRWKEKLQSNDLKTQKSDYPSAILKWKVKRPHTLEEIGFRKSSIEIPSAQISPKLLKNYAQTRDLPAVNGTSKLGIHLRFGTISVREAVRAARKTSETFLNELIWREFFMQILFQFPHVVGHSFRPEYDRIHWENDERNFKAWCEGKTGYPIVDAGMRELNTTGFMHNRVRMIAGSFLVKHLLIDWRWGEKYFADRLLDFELASNNGNWQWVAGTGCDAAPYFRVFNPEAQQKRFDPKYEYVKKWVPEYGTKTYPEKMIDHQFARQRALQEYKRALSEARL